MAITIVPTGFEGFGDAFSSGIERGFMARMEKDLKEKELEKKAKLDIGDLATIALFESSGVLPDGSKNAYLNQFNELSNQATQATGVPEQSGGIQQPNMQPMTVNQIQGLPRVGLNDVLMNKQFGYQTDPMVARNTAMKVAEQRALIDPKVEEQKALTQPRVDEQVQKDIASQNLKRSIYGKDLQNFMAIDNILHESRGSGTKRIKAGLDMSIQGFKQDSTLGRAVAAHDAASKRLRVQLVRAAGDVGNINIVEQKAAELLVPSRYDDKGTAEIKRAYLKDLAQAINSEEPSQVKAVIERFMKEDSYKSNVVIVNDPISGKTLHLPKDKVDDYNKYLKSKGL